MSNLPKPLQDVVERFSSLPGIGPKSKAVRAQELEDAKAAKEDLEGKTFTIEKTAGENGKLFGSLTSMDVAELLKDAGYKVDKRDISFEDDVKTVGTVNTQVKLHNDVTANIKVEVKAADKVE